MKNTKKSYRKPSLPTDNEEQKLIAWLRCRNEEKKILARRNTKNSRICKKKSKRGPFMKF